MGHSIMCMHHTDQRGTARHAHLSDGRELDCATALPLASVSTTSGVVKYGQPKMAWPPDASISILWCHALIRSRVNVHEVEAAGTTAPHGVGLG